MLLKCYNNSEVLKSIVMLRRCEMCCNTWGHYDPVTHYNRGFQFSDIFIKICIHALLFLSLFIPLHVKP